MRYKIGDLVIKNTGGNKMVINSIDNLPIGYQCIWFVGNDFHSEYFSEDQIMLVSDYHKVEKRNLYISEILNNK